MRALRAEDPETLGGHRLLARLGAGGMGVVYLARTEAGALVALKMIRAEHAADPAFRARWLVARRSPVVMGIAAVARFDTHAYRSPDWRAFLGDAPRRAIEGLPGTWVGMEFDFTIGEDGEKPGLPDEAVRCLDGT